MSAAIAGVLFLGLAGCGLEIVEVTAPSAGAPSTASTAAPGWQELPDAPLSARTASVAAWTGTEALFIGGETDNFCPPNATCDGVVVGVKDGAAYDPTTRRWRRIADAPEPVTGPQAPVVLDIEVFLLADEGLLLAYDVARDDWTNHGPMPKGSQGSTLTASGDGRLIVTASGIGPDARDHVYDPRTRAWSELPAAPAGLGHDGYRRYVATPAGLVLFGAREPVRPDRPSLIDAAVLDLDSGRWRDLPAGEQIDADFHWTGTRLVNTQLGGADGGRVNGWGRTYPNGGTLDPGTGTWGPLPNAPTRHSDGWTVDARSGRWTATAGWIYDDAEETWTRVPRPATAARAAGAAVWAGDLLIAFGGAPDFGADDAATGPSNAAWSYRTG